MLKQKKLHYLLIIPVFIFVLLLGCFTTMQNADIFANAKEKEVYLGGQPIGLNLFSEGLIVIDYKPIITNSGTVSPAKESGLLVGDMIIKVGDNNIKTPQELQNEINKNEQNKLTITILRQSNTLKISVTPVFDPLAGACKLGLIVKNDISGVGTLTYVDDAGNYCSLGHKICDPKLNNTALYQNGKIYPAKILGVYKGNNEEAGALKGTFDKASKPYGCTIRNCEYGVYGKIDNVKSFKPHEKIQIGSKAEVKPGKAHIYTTIDGNTPDKYDIEIVKCYNQDKPTIKSMVIRVTDKRLLDNCGGIVQGMSGSPIIQNGKLVGAVTHVFLNDASIGYGVYIDWLF